MVFRVSQLFSAKSSPTTHRSHQTYYTLQSPTSPKFSAKAHWKHGPTLLRSQSQDVRQACGDDTFLEKLQ